MVEFRDWRNKGHGMCYSVCRRVLCASLNKIIKDLAFRNEIYIIQHSLQRAAILINISNFLIS